jgi:hypothetical protein
MGDDPDNAQSRAETIRVWFFLRRLGDQEPGLVALVRGMVPASAGRAPRAWCVHGSSALTGQGLQEGFEWLARYHQSERTRN